MVKALRKPAAKGKKPPAKPSKPQQPSEESVSRSSSEQSSSSSSPSPVQANIKTLQFRKRRGEKMNYLINKKKDDEEEDDFWKNNAYFGDAEDVDEEDEEEEYVESSSGEDEFDSDFLSNKEDEKEEEGEVGAEEEQSPSRRKRKPIETVKPPVKKAKPAQSNHAGTPPPASKPLVLKYIHQQFTQEQLLAEAAHTEYYNYLSLQKLISLQQGKKTYHRRQIEIETPKIQYKSRLQDGNVVTTYTMVGFEEGISFLDIEDPI